MTREQNTTSFTKTAGVVIIILLLAYTSVCAVAMTVCTSDQISDIATLATPLSMLLNGLALIGLFYTLSQSRNQLEMQTEELALQRAELIEARTANIQMFEEMCRQNRLSSIQVKLTILNSKLAFKKSELRNDNPSGERARTLKKECEAIAADTNSTLIDLAEAMNTN